MKKRKLAATLIALLLILTAGAGSAETEPAEWFTFLLLCNEGMLNTGGNVGNTIMVFSVNPKAGIVKQLSFLWDTFIDYPGFETPQLLDQPFRVGGPEETLALFNRNFGQEIESFLSINFLNLSMLIDDFGGVTLNITRAERNALNGMVGSKVAGATSAMENLGLDESAYNKILDAYYLLGYGPNTHVSGIQAVGYGWLQHDSVEECCRREVEVISQLFFNMRAFVEEQAFFYADESELPKDLMGKRPIKTGALTGDDRDFVYQLLSPVFNRSYHNLTRQQIDSILEAIIHSGPSTEIGYESIQQNILPLEYQDEKTNIAGVDGIVVDYAANKDALDRFLFDESHAPMVLSPNTEGP